MFFIFGAIRWTKNINGSHALRKTFNDFILDVNSVQFVSQLDLTFALTEESEHRLSLIFHIRRDLKLCFAVLVSEWYSKRVAKSEAIVTIEVQCKL